MVGAGDDRPGRGRCGVSDITWGDAYDTSEEYERAMAEDEAYYCRFWNPYSDPVDLAAYDTDDPKRWALDHDFDPDLVRDMERGK